MTSSISLVSLDSLVSYTHLMIKLPAALERKLQALFPRARERDQFVAEVVSKALETTQSVPDTHQPEAVGGTLHLYTDGGSRGNPGQAAVGCVLIDPLQERVLKEYSECIGVATNNVAEYQALIAGLKMAKGFQPNCLVCHLDSELVVKQLNGEYRVKMPTLQPLLDEILELKVEFPSVLFTHIPREKNTRADLLVNKALDELRIGMKR